MPYEVSYDEAGGMAVARVSGEATHAEHCAAREEALRLCAEKRCPRILVDLRGLSTSRSTYMNCFDFGESLARASNGLSIALVLPSDAKSKSDVSFTSTVAANRGVRSLEFDDIGAARNWLRQKP